MTEQEIRVLSIEDNPGDALLIQEKLAEAQPRGWNLPHFEVEHVTRLEDALARLADGGIDVVLSDLDLPDSRAKETVATLRKQIPHMPLVVLTGREDEALARQSVRAGVQDYLYKHEATGNLLARSMMYAIERQQTRAQLERRVVTRTGELQQANERLRQANRALEAEIAEHKRTEQALVKQTRALRASEARERARTEDLRTIMNAVPAVIWTARDPACRQVTGNPASYRLLRMNEDQNTSMTPEEDAPPSHFKLLHDGREIPPEKLPMQLACAQGVTTENHEMEIVFDDDTRCTLFGNTVPVRDAEGEIRGAVSAYIDITERKQAEAALRESEQRFRALFEEVQIGIVLVDRAAKIQIANPYMCRWLGYTAEELQQLTIDAITFPEDLEKERSLIQALREGKRDLVRLEKRYVRKDGEPIWGDLITNTVRDEQGNFLFGLGTVIDISQRKRAEAALRESEERLDLALHGGGLGTWDWDLQTDEVRFDERWAEMLGYSLEALAPRLSTWEELVHPNDLAGAHEKLQAHFDGTTPFYEAEFRMRHRSGEWRWILDRGKVMERDAAGRPLRACGTHLDITERKRTQEKLERYAADLERSNRELEQFAYVISHDLHAPARMVSGYLELLVRRYQAQLDEKANEYITYAVENADRMQQMIDALLDLSRVKTRGHELVPTDVEALLTRTLNSLGRVIEKAEAVITHDPLPTVMADRAQLTQVFQNLIANALKFQRQDAVPRVHIAAERTGETWTFSITDNGIGIDPAHTERIFQIFQRLHTEAEYPGTGIGLALCKRIVERHGGRIWVESAPGAGSTFYFTLNAMTDDGPYTPTER